MSHGSATPQDLADIERLEAILRGTMTDRSERPGEWDATWEGARRQLHESILAATPLQRLEWLEEVLELAYLVGALDAPPSSPGRSS